ncbi:MAG: [Fe-Fe] hydrogenase large subunit C-terminal domain-containing protein [Bacteroidales bacterium]|nr:[Fe-Fe] hydrogenase large subunit C-terminal domain-containing protein [Bacteroidales bacterium]
MELINFKQDNCKRCYACVRSCPVKAITLLHKNGFPQVLHDRCIGCGVCLNECPASALSFKDSTVAVKQLLQSEAKVAAIVDPSVSGEFPDIADYRRFVKMFRSLGFDYVNEVSFGADLVAQAYKDILENFKGVYYITTKCPTVVAYVEKYFPELIPNLVPIVEPMFATAQIVHQQYGDDVKVVYIAPCLSAKYEISRFEGNSKIDEVLTFIELRQLFNEFHIKEDFMEFSEFDDPLGYKGALFPLRQGLLTAADLKNDILTGNIVVSSGAGDVKKALESFQTDSKEIHRHFDLFFCDGCIVGPCMSKNGVKFLRHTLTTDYVNKRLKDFDMQKWNQQIERSKSLDLSRTFQEDDQRLAMPSDEKIKDVFKTLNINMVDDVSKMGCGACGFDTCLEFAQAVGQGLMSPDLCMHYTFDNQENYIATLKETNTKLEETERALKQSEQIARKEQSVATDAKETFKVMMQKLPVGVVIVDENLNVIHCNRSFIDLLGDDAKMIDEVIPGLQGADLKTLVPFSFYNLFSFVLKNNENVTNKDTWVEEQLLNVSVFPIQQFKVVGAVIRDLRSPEVRREQVIKRVTEVIDENLSMVQKIGFLLGEGAATTEKMLNSIIDTYKNDNEAVE